MPPVCPDRGETPLRGDGNRPEEHLARRAGAARVGNVGGVASRVSGGAGEPDRVATLGVTFFFTASAQCQVSRGSAPPDSALPPTGRPHAGRILQYNGTDGLGTSWPTASSTGSASPCGRARSRPRRDRAHGRQDGGAGPHRRTDPGGVPGRGGRTASGKDRGAHRQAGRQRGRDQQRHRQGRRRWRRHVDRRFPRPQPADRLRGLPPWHPGLQRDQHLPTHYPPRATRAALPPRPDRGIRISPGIPGRGTTQRPQSRSRCAR